MLKRLKYFFLILTITLQAQQELEVRLETKVPLKPIYLSRLHPVIPTENVREADELRSILAYDLANNGYSSVVSTFELAEQKIGSDLRKIDTAFWKKERIPFVIVLENSQNSITATLLQIDKGSMKRYAEIVLSHQSETDQLAIHKLADAIQKDLFGTQGIASLRLIYSQRSKNNESNSPEWSSDIWTCFWNGSHPKRLTMAKGYCMSPGFLPSNKLKQYFYVSTNRGQSKILRSRFNDTQSDVWIHLRGSQLLPAIAKDGSKIAFITDVAGRPDLFIQHLDVNGNEAGKPYQLFTAPNATQASPTFSPDGRHIAFVSDKGGSPRVYVMEIRDPREVRHPELKVITKVNRENTSPAWSPDGKKIAYSARSDGVRQIWIYDFTKDQEWQLTSGPENKENPSWAPDSIHLVYNTETKDVSELYMINLHQQEPVLIHLGYGQKRFASWEPR